MNGTEMNSSKINGSEIEKMFKEILEFIQKETGISLPETNYNLVRSFIEGRREELSLSQEDYLKRLKQDTEELAEFLDAVTINETYFFREEKHFRVLEKFVFPQVFNTHKREVSLWSATCSTGEEAVSLGAIALDYSRRAAKLVKVFATDLNPLALSFFEKGVFKKNSFRNDGLTYHHLVKSQLDKDGYTLVGPVKDIITITYINLFRDDFSSLPEDLDIIFFRNTLIYMTMEIRNAILDKIVERAAPGGYIFLSSSEMPLISHPELKLVEKEGVYFFRKKTEEERKQGISFDSKLIEVLDEEKQVITKKPRLREKVKPSTLSGKGDGKVPAKQRVQVEQICTYANQKCNNRLFTRENDPNYEASVLYLKVLVQINAGRMNQALSILDDAKKKYGENELHAFLKGYAYMVSEKREEADLWFVKALTMAPFFWPARYYRAMMGREVNLSQALIDFEKTAEIIRKYIKEDKFTYQFLLEGFNAKYFLNICTRWIEKLKGV